MSKVSMETIISLCKRRGFVLPGSEIYGGLANSWDYGHLGVLLKNNIKQQWWNRFVRSRTDMVGIDAALIMNPRVWEASGHVGHFSDPLVECKECKNRMRADKIAEDQLGTRLDYAADKIVSDLRTLLGSVDNFLINKNKDLNDFNNARQFDTANNTEYPKFMSFVSNQLMKKPQVELEEISKLLDESNLDRINNLIDLIIKYKYLKCENCNSIIEGKPRQFNMMLKTFLGPSEDSASVAYLRPETAQAMFVDFKSVQQTSRKKLPLGIAQQGKAFRNEITPGNFIFRTREFEQMEIEYFVNPKEWSEKFEYWLGEMKQWLHKDLGVKEENLVYHEIPDGERAHYSARTVDIEYHYPFGLKELYGIAYRGDYDLSNHQKASGEDMSYLDPHTNEKFTPHVIEPTFGVDRSFLVTLCEAYDEQKVESKDGEEGDTRIVLHLPKRLAPYFVAILPLSKKEELLVPAEKLFADLSKYFSVDYDETQSIGKRYRRQDEVGTPYCITVDFDTLQDEAVTVRDRDTMTQERVKISDLISYLQNKYNS